MTGTKFEIIATRWGSPQKYRMTVEIVHYTDQLARFKISAGDKHMYMEKHLAKKTNQWKLGAANYKLDGDPREIAGAILNIQKELDYYLDKHKSFKEL